MSNPYFKFKQFTVWHNQCAMRVNTDGVMLGAWASVSNASQILDIGTGTGLIALMLAQRSTASVHGVEIEKNAYHQAVYNVEQSPWASRVQMFHDDFCRFQPTSTEKYDLIVTNPPYFINSLKNSRDTKTLARHNNSLPFDTLIKGVELLLTSEGTFTVILPANTAEFEQVAFIHQLYCSRRMRIRSLPHKDVFREMLEFKKSPQKQCIVEELDIYLQPGSYSPEYIQLTKDFYLNF